MRRVRRVVIFLVIGAVVNVLVAWGCARWGDEPSTSMWGAGTPVHRVPQRAAVIVDEPDFMLMRVAGNATGLDVLESGTWSGTLVRYSRWTPEPVDGLRRSLESYQYGLPFRSVAVDYRTQLDIGSAGDFRSWRVAGWHGGWPWAPTVEQSKSGIIDGAKFVLPTAVIPIGFAANTAFYALLAWLPVVGFAALRRRRRAKRGLCVACGYEVGSLAVCPECGGARR